MDNFPGLSLSLSLSPHTRAQRETPPPVPIAFSPVSHPPPVRSLSTRYSHPYVLETTLSCHWSTLPTSLCPSPAYPSPHASGPCNMKPYRSKNIKMLLLLQITLNLFNFGGNFLLCCPHKRTCVLF